MRETDFGFFPEKLFTLSLIGLCGIGLNEGHHASVHLRDHGRHARNRRPGGLVRAGLENGLGVGLGDPAHRALGEHHAVVLDQLIHRLGKAPIGAKVGHGALKRPRATAVAHLGASRKGAKAKAPSAILGFRYRNVAEGGVPAEFFLPSRQTPPVCCNSREVFCT